MRFIIPLLATCLAATLAAPVPAPQGRQGQGNGAPATTNTNTQGGKPANAAPAPAAASASPAAAFPGTQAAPATGNAGKQGGKGGQGAQAAQASPSPAAANPGTGTATTGATQNGGGKGGANTNPAPGSGNTAPTQGGATGKGAPGNGNPTPTTGGTSTGGKGGDSNAQAAQAWMADTGVVSDFLNRATSLKGSAFTAAATKALAAEKDELTHKAVLDADPSLKSQVATANNVLATQGNFQQVVDLLQDMVTKGDSAAAKDVPAINKVRCPNVLPDIDIYLAAAGTSLKAVRPTAC